MYFKQFYLACLAHASYLIGSEGEAAVVDPQRDVDEYLADAAAQGLQIKYVIETHLHADFVSGHQELAARTGATIVFGERAVRRSTNVPCRTAKRTGWAKWACGSWKLRDKRPKESSALLITTKSSNRRKRF